MDMYQKRKMRKEKSVNNVEENSKMNINWVMLFYGNTGKNVDISSFL